MGKSNNTSNKIAITLVGIARCILAGILFIGAVKVLLIGHPWAFVALIIAGVTVVPDIKKDQLTA